MLFPQQFAESGCVKHNQTSPKHSLGGLLWKPDAFNPVPFFDVTTSKANSYRCNSPWCACGGWTCRWRCGSRGHTCRASLLCGCAGASGGHWAAWTASRSLYSCTDARLTTCREGSRFSDLYEQTAYKYNVQWFTCVYFQVLMEGVPLSEAAAALLALVRFGAGVDVGVVSQVLFGCKALSAGLAHERFLSWRD